MTTDSSSITARFTAPDWSVDSVNLFGNEISQGDVQGSGLDKKALAVMKIISKLPDVQTLINGGVDSAVLKISKKHGVTLHLGESEYSVGTFDQILNAGISTRIKPRAGKLSRAGKELYESVIKAEELDSRSKMKSFVADRSPDQDAEENEDEKPLVKTETSSETMRDAETARNKPWSLQNKVGDGLGAQIDMISDTRNGMTLLSKTWSAFEFATKPLLVMGTVNGGLGVLNGAYGTVKHLHRAKKSYNIGDRTGVANSLITATILAAYGTTSGSGLTAASAALANASAGQAALAGTVSGLIMGGMLTIQGARGIKSARTFSQEMDGILKAGGNEKQRLIDALMTLKQKVTLSRAEYETVKDKPEEIKNLMLKKGAEFARATSEDCLNEVLKIEDGKLVLDNILDGLLSGESNAIDKAKGLLQLVYKANYRAKVTSITFLALGVLAVVAFVLDYFFTGGIANLVFMIGAGLWLWIDSSKVGDWINEQIWKERGEFVLPDILRTEPLKIGTIKDDAKFFAKIAAAVATSFVWAPIAYVLLDTSIGQRIAKMWEEKMLERKKAQDDQVDLLAAQET